MQEDSDLNGDIVATAHGIPRVCALRGMVQIAPVAVNRHSSQPVPDASLFKGAFLKL